MHQNSINITSKTGNKEMFLLGVKDCLPTVLGYFSIGIAAGVVSSASGLSVAEITLLSIILYAGSGQFVTASMIESGSTFFTIVFAIFLLNLRHLLFSAAVAPYCRKNSIWKNFLIGSYLTDETFGVASSRISAKNETNFWWFFGLNITAYINWVLANIIGAVFGGFITNTESVGMDLALPAMFAGLLVLQIISKDKKSLDIFIAAITVIILVVVNVIYPSMWSVMISTVIAATIGMVSKRWK